MATVLVMVTDVRVHEPDQVALAKDDYVLEKLPTAASDPALRHGILPRTAERDAARSRTHCLYETYHRGTEDRVSIEDAAPRRTVEGKRFAQLLDYPCSRRVEGGIEVQNLPATVLDDEESIQ